MSQEQKENKEMRKLVDSMNLLSKQLPNVKPKEPVAGDVYHDPLTLTVKYFNGKGWNVIFSDDEAAQGTVSPPAYSFTDDTNTGWFYSKEDEIKFVIDGIVNDDAPQLGGDLDFKYTLIDEYKNDPIRFIEEFIPYPQTQELQPFHKELLKSMQLPDWSVNPAHNNDGNFTITQDEREVLDPTYEKVEKEEELEDAYKRAMKVL